MYVLQAFHRVGNVPMEGTHTCMMADTDFRMRREACSQGVHQSRKRRKEEKRSFL
jgi:hypothetical protein